VGRAADAGRTVQHAVTGRFGSLDGARRALEQLQNHGVDSADIRLSGEAADRAAADAAVPGGTSGVQRRLVRRYAAASLVGALAGLFAGAVLGAIVASVLRAVGWDAAGSAGWFAFVVVAFALIGATVGLLVRIERTTGYDDTWELALDRVEGTAWVVVRVDPADRRTAASVRKVLEDAGAVVEERQVAARPSDPNRATW